MNALLLTILGIAAVAQASTPAAPGETGRQYLEKLYRDRAAITSGYIEFTVTQDLETKHKNIEGSVRSYRVWFDKDRTRVDLKIVRPLDPTHPVVSRYAIADGVCRVVNSDSPNLSVSEDTKDHMRGQEPLALATFVDPRLFGTFPMIFGSLRLERINYLKNVDSKATITVSPGLNSGGVDRVTVQQTNGVVKIWDFSPGSAMPVRLVSKSAPNFPDGKPGPDTRIEVESELVAMPNSRGERYDFPRRLKARVTTDGQLVEAETLTVHKADFNVPLNAADFTWKALQPAVGCHIVVNDKYRQDLMWGGEKFVAAPPETSSSPELQVEPLVVADRGLPLRRLALLLVGIGIPLAVVSGALRLRKRRRATL